jgi:hypothetical protein
MGADAESASGTQVARVFRSGRLFRVIKSATTLRMLFNTLIASLPALANILMLLVLMLFVLACFGMQVFSEVRCLQCYTPMQLR